MSTVSPGDYEVADSVGFEPTRALPLLVFETSAISRTLPTVLKWCAQPELNRRLPGFNRALEPSQLQALEVSQRALRPVEPEVETSVGLEPTFPELQSGACALSASPS